jgi:hypothetical protein
VQRLAEETGVARQRTGEWKLRKQLLSDASARGLDAPTEEHTPTSAKCDDFGLLPTEYNKKNSLFMRSD